MNIQNNFTLLANSPQSYLAASISKPSPVPIILLSISYHDWYIEYIHELACRFLRYFIIFLFIELFAFCWMSINYDISNLHKKKVCFSSISFPFIHAHHSLFIFSSFFFFYFLCSALHWVMHNFLSFFPPVVERCFVKQEASICGIWEILKRY